MDFANAFASLAAKIPVVWEDAQARWPGVPTLDSGGSVSTPSAPQQATCRVQFDACTRAMREDADFQASDVRMLILATGLLRQIDQGATILVADGRNAGRWSIRSVSMDPAQIGYDCRGRKCP